ncbi:MAG: Holliday junction branch migration protein RuvA [Propionibacteriaceae bacterium]|jgi:Holliday junction DNA helicase RuvA|nr:Holliday junction branch migration protein RuvA [Propionibacteriaceae bacterium]
MIASLSGLVTELNPTSATIEVGGVGLTVWCAPATVQQLRIGQPARLQTHLMVRQDALTLFGFSTAADREAFVLVQTASGVGPKLALAILSVLDAGELARAVAEEDLARLCRVPGVGRKVAQRLVIELKDKLNRLVQVAPSSGASGDGLWQEQVSSGLVGLGYSSRDADQAVQAVAELVEADPDLTVAALMRAALRRLAK